MNGFEDWLGALTTEELAAAYPSLFPTARAMRRWYAEREKNGLDEAGCVKMTRSHELRWLPEKTVSWYLRLEG